MWYKKEAIGLWIWIPNNYKFNESLAFFTIKNNILDENKQVQYDGLNKLKDIATIVIYENNADDGAIELFEKYIIGPLDGDVSASVPKLTAPIIGIFSFKRNRYSKPYTGAYELLEQIANNARDELSAQSANKLNDEKNDTFKFRPEWSIMVSFNVGINGHYIDRAFAHNIGIKSVTIPSIYFASKELATKKIGWCWPSNVLTERQKKKIFQFEGELKFSDFLFPGHINIVVITGPPNSGKTILGRRIATYIGKCIICKNELPRVLGKSLVHISQAPAANDKQKLIKWLMEYNKPYAVNASGLIISVAIAKDKCIIEDVPISTLAATKGGECHNGKENKLTMPNLVWIEMEVPKLLVDFLRHLYVQVNRQSCPVLSPHSDIANYYKLKKPLHDDFIPSVITHMHFPLILKKIPELNYIY